jgi:hypothetical protein
MRATVLGVVVLMLGACSGESETAPIGTDGGGATDAGATAESGSGDAKGGSTIGAPTLDKIMKMTGGLHVFWSNPAGVECDTIEGERKTPTTDYKVAFTVPGSVDNKHDATATEKTTYTYRLRCKVGNDYSDYSNEKTGSPQ